MHDKQVRRRRAVFAALVAVSLILLTAYFGESPSSPLHGVQRGIVQVLSPLQAGASKVLSPVRDVANWVSDTLHAKSRADSLQRKVNSLEAQVAQLKVEQQQNAQLTAQVGLDQRIGVSSYQPVGANVVGRDPSLWYQTVSIDAGSGRGITLHDPVIADGALVGLVTTVGSSYSIVSLITDPNVQVGSEVLDAHNDQGVVGPSVGNPNQLLIQDLGSTAPVLAGQTVVTSGYKFGKYASYYPPGLPIGTVPGLSSLSQSQISSDLLNGNGIPVQPLADLRHFDSVQVLTRPLASNARAQVP